MASRVAPAATILGHASFATTERHITKAIGRSGPAFSGRHREPTRSPQAKVVRPL